MKNLNQKINKYMIEIISKKMNKTQSQNETNRLMRLMLKSGLIEAKKTHVTMYDDFKAIIDHDIAKPQQAFTAVDQLGCALPEKKFQNEELKGRTSANFTYVNSDETHHYFSWSKFYGDRRGFLRIPRAV